MISVTGRIATPLDTKYPKKSDDSKPYFVFRLADNSGQKDSDPKQIVWYSVLAFIPELDADLLSKGMLVKVTGKLEAKAYLDKDNNPQVSLTLISSSVEPLVKS